MAQQPHPGLVATNNLLDYMTLQRVLERVPLKAGLFGYRYIEFGPDIWDEGVWEKFLEIVEIYNADARYPKRLFHNKRSRRVEGFLKSYAGIVPIFNQKWDEARREYKMWHPEPNEKDPIGEEGKKTCSSEPESID